MSLLELSVVITAILALLSIAFFGTRGWMRGSDRSTCVLTTRNVQVAMRSYQNLYGYNFGGRPYADRGTQDIAEHLFNKGYIEDKVFKQVTGKSTCNGGGTYLRTTPDIFPPQGELYMNCALAATQDHKPKSYEDW